MVGHVGQFGLRALKLGDVVDSGDPSSVVERLKRDGR
jgi:hypothetical protein